MHHPLAYPYTFLERHLPSMVLRNALACARELRNDRNDPQDIGPLAHLFLSGHTHHCYPAGALPSSVTAIRQGDLSAWQLQLVGGPLMLNQSTKAARAQAHGNHTVKQDPTHPRYQPTTTDNRTCQAQILRFFADSEEPGNLTMLRIPVYSVDGSVYSHERASVVTMTYDTPPPSTGR